MRRAREGRHWNRCFSSHLNNWELEIVGSFFFILQEKFVERVEDRMVWMGSRNGCFFGQISLFYVGAEVPHPFPRRHYLEFVGLV